MTDRVIKRDWKLNDITEGLYVIFCSDESIIYQIGYGAYLGWATDPVKKGLRVEFHILTYHEEKSRYYLHRIDNGSGKIRHYQPTAIHHPPMGFTLESLCEYLNEDKYGYRPATKEDVLEVIQRSNKNFLLPIK